MVISDLLPALPLIEEDIARLLSHIAKKNNHPKIYDLFYDYASINSSGEFDDMNKSIRKEIIDKGIATPERLDLFLYRRQLIMAKIKPAKIAAVVLPEYCA